MGGVSGEKPERKVISYYYKVEELIKETCLAWCRFLHKVVISTRHSWKNRLEVRTRK